MHGVSKKLLSVHKILLKVHSLRRLTNACFGVDHYPSSSYYLTSRYYSTCHLSRHPDYMHGVSKKLLSVHKILLKVHSLRRLTNACFGVDHYPSSSYYLTSRYYSICHLSRHPIHAKTVFILKWFTDPFLRHSASMRSLHDDVIKWKHFPHYWPYVRGIYRSPVNSHKKGHWRGDFFSLNKRWSKQSRRRWFERPSRSSRCHCDDSQLFEYLVSVNLWIQNTLKCIHLNK